MGLKDGLLPTCAISDAFSSLLNEASFLFFPAWLWYVWLDPLRLQIYRSVLLATVAQRKEANRRAKRHAQ